MNEKQKQPKIQRDLDTYYSSCDEVAHDFYKEYFRGSTDLYWVNSEPGTVICINDYYWNMDDMVEALKVGVNRKILFQYYDWSVDGNDEESKSLHYFLNLKKINEK